MSRRQMPFIAFVFVIAAALVPGPVFARDLASAPPAVQQGPEQSSRLSFPFVPDATQTKGSLCSPQNPDFERYRYDEEIAYCARNVSAETKAAIYRAYHVSSKCKSEYTIDHFIPLALGGTNEPDNLWPEPRSIKALRYNLENELYHKMDAGTITQAEAVRIVIHAKLNPPVTNPSDFSFCQ